MKTAIQGLIDEIEEYKKESGGDSISIELILVRLKRTYLSVEKQQIIEAYEDGESRGESAGFGNPEEYYNYTFIL